MKKAVNDPPLNLLPAYNGGCFGEVGKLVIASLVSLIGNKKAMMAMMALYNKIARPESRATLQIEKTGGNA